MRAAPHRSSADRDAALRWDFLPTTHLKNDAAKDRKRRWRRNDLGGSWENRSHQKEGKQEGQEVEETREKETWRKMKVRTAGRKREKQRGRMAQD